MGRATYLQMNLWQSWKKAVASGRKLPSRCCAGCGVNMAHWSTLSKRPARCSALPKYVQVYFREAVPLIFKYFQWNRWADVTWFALAGGHGVEAGDGSELGHLSVSQLAVRNCTAEVRRALRTDLPEVFWDDRSTVSGLCFVDVNFGVTVFLARFLTPLYICFLLAEFSQAVQGDRSSYGDRVMEGAPKCFSQL